MTNSNAIAVVRGKFNLLRSIMDERMRRRWAASEAIALGGAASSPWLKRRDCHGRQLGEASLKLRDVKSRDGEMPNDACVAVWTGRGTLDAHTN